MEEPTKPSLTANLFKIFGRSRVTEPKVATTASSGSSSTLPDPGEPKVKGGKGVGTAVPTMFDSAKPSTTSAMTETDRRVANIDLTSLRSGNVTKELVETYVRVNPELGSAVDAYQRLGLTEYTVIAYDRLTNQPSLEATAFLWSWINYNDKMGDYTKGYLSNRPLGAILQSLGMEMRLNGSCAVEVVLGPTRQALYLQPVGTRALKWWPSNDGKSALPAQDIGGNKIDLNIPTFHYISLDQSLYIPNSESPLESALQPVLMSLQFLNDVRRVVRGAIHPRVTVKINTEKLKELMPQEARVSEESQNKFLKSVVEQVTSEMNGLEPEDALTYLDLMEVNILNRGNTSLEREYSVIESMATSKISSGAKTLPSVIGRGEGQNVASTESMIFVRQVEGSHQKPLNMLMCRVMTQIARLAGFDVYSEFKLDPINLRPDIELAGFKAQNNAMVLEQLSLGILSDAEAWVSLTGKPPPPDAPQLSGTGFYQKSDKSLSDGNPYSGTSGPGADGGGGALNETLKPKTSPAKAGDTKKRQ